MDSSKISSYEAPRVVDYGDLQELTAACLGGTGGDAFHPGGYVGEISIGPSNPAAGCTSTP